MKKICPLLTVCKMPNIRLCLSRLWSHNLLRHHVILYCVTFLVILPFACKDIRFSVYFRKWSSSDNAKELVRIENDARLQRAEAYFEHVPFSDISNKILKPIAESEGKISIALSVITVSRNRHFVDSYQPKYLTQVVWRLLDLANKSSALIHASSYAFHFSLCNVDFDPSNYDELKSLSNFTIHQRFKKMSLTLDHPLEKEKQDYIFCMNSSSVPSRDYIFLLEDDAYPTEDFFPVLIHTLNRLSSPQDHKHDTSPAYVKFYHPERLSVFHLGDVVSVLELVSWVLLAGTIFHITFCFFALQPFGRYTSWLLCFVYAFFLAVAINRPGLMELRRLSPSLYSLLPAPSCCTPAMLFPVSSARVIASHMQGITCRQNFGKDSILDDFLKLSKLKAYVVQPNVVVHIGMYSALRQNIVDPFLM